MNRRQLLAGGLGLGTFVAGGALARGVFSTSANELPGGEADSDGPIEVETIEAPGSEATRLSVPTDGVMLLNFFAPPCGSCRRLMSPLADARAELDETYGDTLTTLSITVTPAEDDELRQWWIDHGGDWFVGYDTDSTLARAYGVVGYPVLVAVDSSGERRWRETGVLESSRIVRGVERAFDKVGQ